MDIYTSDDEAVEKLRKWWSENGAFIIMGLVLGGASLFGWRYWTEYREHSYAMASDAYQQVLAAGQSGEHARAAALAVEIRGLRLRTPYVDLAALAVAQHSVVAEDMASAQLMLAQLIEDARDLHVRHLARLRLARLLLADGDVAGAEQVLRVTNLGSYAPLYAELRGDAALARGDRDTAIAAYREALAAEDGIADAAMLEMRLNDLGASSGVRES